jgi:fructokinase
VLSRLFGCGEQEVIPGIFKKYRAEWIAVTRGAAGCELHTRTRCVTSAAPQVKCVDAVGAGDAFSAALVMGLLKRRSLEEVANDANRIGAFVASQSGAMPILTPELLPR